MVIEYRKNRLYDVLSINSRFLSIKKCLRHFNPLPPILGELGVSFYDVFLHNSLMNILQTILKDHYEEMIYTFHPRASVIENVDKMINCGNPAFTTAMKMMHMSKKLFPLWNS